ncbi:MAG: hypothetical protein BMS9Abin02_0531 [Anaerolineae bacterium]|nr:MAG: hypothetical protein BMS9Abin02_0531 [Anaerolineae bacterium]
MTGIIFPIILAVGALILALSAYRGIRRGAARFYTLERETMLRRAGFALLGSIVLFLGAMSLLVYSYQQLVSPESSNSSNGSSINPTTSSDQVLQTVPPTPTPTATPDPSIPTPTATPIICRAIVDGTAGSGLTLRESPNGPEVAILPDGTILTLLEDEPEEISNFIWRKVRTISREEGWVVEEFLKIGECG